MHYLKHFPVVIAAAFGIAACQPSKPAPALLLLPYFQSVQASDTLKFLVAGEGETGISGGDTIPNSVFFAVLDSALLRQIDYIADSAEALIVGRQRFALDDKVECCLVDIRQLWFQHQSLLLVDKNTQAIIDRITVAEWYGGDGGQILTGSWLVDYDGDGHKDLIRREIGHSIILLENSTLDTTYESAALFRWQDGRFVESPLSDTALTVKQFPIPSFW